MRKMKDSGIEWIGMIPKDWSITKIKFLLSNENDSLKVGPFGSQLSGTDFVAEGYWVYSQRVVLDKNFEHNSMLVTKEKFDAMSAFRVRENDILITTRGTIGKICRVPKKFSEGILHPCIIKFRIDEQKYCYKLLELIFNHSGILQKQLNYLSNATTIEVIYSGTLKNLQIPFPPIDEQQKIADFLDGKCADIDQIRADIEKQIEILMDYKKSVITEAVTKGLDPKSKMKDSGIEWIGKIPEHWGVDKLKFHLKFRGTKNPGDTIVLSLYRELGVVPKDSRDDNHNKTSEDTSNYRFVRNGDFVINKMKAWQGSVAVSDYEGIVSPAYYVYGFSDDLIFKRYFHYLLRNKSYATEFKRLSGGIRVGQWDLPRESLENTLILLPPISEQKAIAAYLDEKCSEIDATIAEKQKQLKTLEEYKKSFIFEYVTGKKEVPA